MSYYCIHLSFSMYAACPCSIRTHTACVTPNWLPNGKWIMISSSVGRDVIVYCPWLSIIQTRAHPPLNIFINNNVTVFFKVWDCILREIYCSLRLQTVTVHNTYTEHLLYRTSGVLLSLIHCRPLILFTFTHSLNIKLFCKYFILKCFNIVFRPRAQVHRPRVYEEVGY